MDMTRRIARAAVALLAAIALAFGITSVSTATPAHRVKAPGIYHPCDLNKNTRAGTGRSTEALCLRVWRHDTYTVSSGGGRSETPAGPAVVTDLVSQARAEGRGSARYLRDGLLNEIEMYGKRDR